MYTSLFAPSRSIPKHCFLCFGAPRPGLPFPGPAQAMSSTPRSMSRSSEPDCSDLGDLEALAGGCDRAPDPKSPRNWPTITYVHEPAVRETDPGSERVSVAVRLPNSELVRLEVGRNSVIDVRALQAATGWALISRFARFQAPARSEIVGSEGGRQVPRVRQRLAAQRLLTPGSKSDRRPARTSCTATAWWQTTWELMCPSTAPRTN